MNDRKATRDAGPHGQRQTGSVSYVLWLGVLALAVWLFLEGLEARAQHEETRGVMHDIADRTREVDRKLLRTQNEIEALERGDPHVIRAKLQERGFVKQGNKQVLPAPVETRKPAADPTPTRSGR